MKKVYFYDTNALINSLETVQERDGHFYLSSKTIEELENIKTSGKKDEQTKFNARQAVRWLDENSDKFVCIYPEVEVYNIIYEHELETSNDMIIVASACFMSQKVEKDEELIFVSDDLLCKLTARILGLTVEGIVEKKEDSYCGYKVIKDQQQIADFYEKKQNDFDLLVNEYLLVSDDWGNIVDGWKWTKNGFVAVSYKGVKSFQIGNVQPRDYYQACLFDAMHNNKLIMAKGKAGSGKSLLSLSFLFQQLEKGKIEKIIIFNNDTPVRGAVQKGYLKGDVLQKQLDSTIGNFLISKLGSRQMVEMLIMQEKLMLLPMSLIRGFDTTGMKAGIFITECQNTTVDLMRLALQRIGDDSIVIIDGDYKTQVDDYAYEGKNNGMRRVSEVFRGNSCYAEIELNNIYRSEIARIAEGL